jgi:hypothetical protein
MGKGQDKSRRVETKNSRKKEDKKTKKEKHNPKTKP